MYPTRTARPTTRSRRFALAAATLAALSVAPAALRPALAQQDPPAQPATQDDAETAFLRAYYLEVGKNDPTAALAAYDALLGTYGEHAIAKKASLARARCLQALGRYDELKGALDLLAQRYSADAKFIAATRALSAANVLTGADSAGDVRALVRASLRLEDWKNRVAAFGGRAVPVLSELVRSADPSTVQRSSGSLQRIALRGSQTATAALLAAFTDDAVLYRDSLALGLIGGALPDVLGRGIVNLTDTQLRDRVVTSALNVHVNQAWLGEVIVAEEWARRLAFPDEPTKNHGTDRVILSSIAAGPGAARDAALAHLRLYRAESKERFRSPHALFAPPAEVLEDEEALRTLAEHIYSQGYRIEPRASLRDALLRMPETRELALKLTWKFSIRCDDRKLFIAALSSGPWGEVDNNTATRMVNVISESLQPSPSKAEWRAMLVHYPDSHATALLIAMATRGDLTNDFLEVAVDAGLERAVVRWLFEKGCEDGAWATRVVVPLLQNEAAYVRVMAGLVLSKMHNAKTLDATPFAEALAALVTNEFVWTNGRWKTVFSALFDMRPTGPDALAAALPTGSAADWQALRAMNAAGLPQTADVARRMILGDALILDDQSRRQEVGSIADATRMLIAIEGDDAEATLAAALDKPPIVRARSVFSAVWRSGGLSGDVRERLIVAILTNASASGLLPASPKNLTADAQRRVSRRGLASELQVFQVWAAQWQTSLPDPEAAERLGELARSGDPTLRNAAREALAALRGAEEDLAWTRAIVARRTTRERVTAYLSDGDPIKRMAGVAGLVALRAPDALERLLDVAASDTDAKVREEARRALLALGASDLDGPTKSGTTK